MHVPDASGKQAQAHFHSSSAFINPLNIKRYVLTVAFQCLPQNIISEIYKLGNTKDSLNLFQTCTTFAIIILVLYLSAMIRTRNIFLPS